MLFMHALVRNSIEMHYDNLDQLNDLWDAIKEEE